MKTAMTSSCDVLHHGCHSMGLTHLDQRTSTNLAAGFVHLDLQVAASRQLGRDIAGPALRDIEGHNANGIGVMRVQKVGDDRVEIWVLKPPEAEPPWMTR